MFKPGAIIKPKKMPDVILKCIGPIDSFTLKNNELIQNDSFVLTNEFPSFHFLVCIGVINIFYFPGINFYLTHMITHSSGYNNMKIGKDHVYNSTLSFKDSFITRDKFLIHSELIEGNEALGIFYLDKLYKDFENI